MFTNNTYYNGGSNLTLSKVYVYFGSSQASTPSGKFRHYVRTSVHTGDKNYLKISFPIQGYISEELAVLILPSDEKTIVYDYRGYLWTVNPVSGQYASGIGYGIAGTPAAEVFSGYSNLATVLTHGVSRYFSTDWVGESSNVVYDGYWGIDGKAIYKTSFSPSRGHNVRCIQEPN